MADDTIEAFPLTWPVGRPRTRSREDGRFDDKATIGATRDQLLAELGRFGGTRVVISSNMRLRLDGLPYGQQGQPDDTGVAVYFMLKGQPHVIACDRYRKVQHNLRAIAKTVDAQRGILRWGAVTAEQIFAGFKALPPGGSAIVTPAAMTVETAAAFVARAAGDVTAGNVQGDAGVYQSAYRRAAMRWHPDRHGGETRPEWTDLQTAADALKRHHKL